MVSVIIPTFNSEQAITETVESVLAQSYKNWEIVIVDDGSTDGTLEINKNLSEGHDNIRFYERNRHDKKGASVCRNIGIKKANGDYVIFLDSDDLLSKDCLANRISYMREHSHLDFAVFQMKSFGRKETLMTREKKDYLAAFLSFDLPWAITCPIWKQSFLLKIGGFDERFKRIQDPELHVNALTRTDNYTVLYDREPDCYYRREKSETEILKISNNKIDGIILFLTKYMNWNLLDNSKKRHLRPTLALLFMLLSNSQYQQYVNQVRSLIKKAKNVNIIDFRKYLSLRLLSGILCFKICNRGALRKLLYYGMVMTIERDRLIEKNPTLKKYLGS